MPRDERLVLLTGASGYVGGRLLPQLLERHRVRCLSRDPDRLRPRISPDAELAQADLLEPASLGPALEGVHTAYYLVHSMGSEPDFAERDRTAAHNFATAARAAGVSRIIYLGGIGHGDELSEHLASRLETGRILREGEVPTLELRASIIIGSGSVSFAMLRALVEKLPVMVTPSWVRTRCQPISIEDVLQYLLAALELPLDGSRVVEVGGADQLSYQELMAEYAYQRGLTRVMIPVPLLSPGLSSRWLGLVTPVYADIGKHLVEGLRNETIVRDESGAGLFDIEPRGMAAAIRRALVNEDQRYAQTRWVDSVRRGEPGGYGGRDLGPRIVDVQQRTVPVGPEDAFAPIRRIGGATGWYYGNWLWRIRGLLDLVARGPGLRRGRRDPEELHPGEAVDFWRVEEVRPPSFLRLRAEMKVPGRAWLQFELEPDGEGQRITQTAIFDPRGLLGRVYWYLLWPVHAFVFRGMLRNIARAAMRQAG